MKTAVVLFNLGGPDSPSAVKPFLYNLFSDKAIISLPQPLRWCLAGFISSMRAPKAMAIYSRMGGRSPILGETIAQANALERELTVYGEYKTFVCMRYWHPMTPEVVGRVKKYNPDRIILLPLYPQFSTTTTASSIKRWAMDANYARLEKPTVTICCYHSQKDFINAYSELTRESCLQANKAGKIRVLFSAHGIPMNRIHRGDPYQWQVERTVKEVVAAIGIDGLDYVICYQSRVGLLKWLSPSIEEEVIKAARQGLAIVVVPISFVSEHSETLVELDIQYKELAEVNGCSGYYRVPAVRTHKLFIKALASLCVNARDTRCKMNLASCQASYQKGAIC